MIGCGSVTEVKSGPAFNKVPNSKLMAVMRRDAEKVKDYALIPLNDIEDWWNNDGGYGVLNMFISENTYSIENHIWS
jgi:hypothetical protein